MDRELSPEEQELHDLARDIEILRTRYDQYFMGLEKLPPERLRAKVNKVIIKSDLGTARRAALRFRFTRLVQKLRSYESMWDRMMREIETGKRKREVLKGASRQPVNRRYAHAESTASTHKDQEMMAQLAREEASQQDDISLLYKEFVEARKKMGKVTTMDEDAFRRKVAPLRKKTKQLTVQIRNGKVVLVGKKDLKGKAE